jgi:uridine kinase
MVAQKPTLVGIAGGSCAGKTWLAERLQSFLGQEATRLSLDDFYLDRSHLSPGRRALVNFDHPRSIDWQKLEEVLGKLAFGSTAAIPTYDFRTHGRTGRELRLSPGEVVIVEGLWLFRRANLRKLFDLKIYIRSSTSWCKEKRLGRDTVERGRTEEQVLRQLKRFTLPMFEKFVAPQEKWADVVLESPVKETSVKRIGEQLKEGKNLVGI